jgi:hypothetical protein
MGYTAQEITHFENYYPTGVHFSTLVGKTYAYTEFSSRSVPLLNLRQTVQRTKGAIQSVFVFG